MVNLSRLAELYPDGGDVTPENLVANGAVRSGELIKVLGTGDVSVALRVTAHAFSAAAATKIKNAGGHGYRALLAPRASQQGAAPPGPRSATARRGKAAPQSARRRARSSRTNHPPG